MIRCPWCGAQNYAIDSWCSACSRHLEWAPRAPVAAETAPAPSPRRSRHRLLKVLAPAAAGLGVAVVLALPVASWFGAAGAPHALLPTTALRPSAPTPAARSVPASTPSPTPEATPTPDATPNPDQGSTQAAGPVVEAAPPSGGGDPAAAVAHFYQAVAAHDFGAATALWTTRMQARFPPAEYIDHRFAATQQIGVRAERLLGAGDGVAVVYVDVIESIDGQTRRWVGTWQLVDTDAGWLLNQPNLRAA
jgi:hypothetical protein